MLDVRQLDALAAVIEHGSFGAAARALSLTLAAVSLRIKSLEAALGQRLLVRGKQLRATPAGQALLGHVRQLRLMEADLLAPNNGAALGDNHIAAKNAALLQVVVTQGIGLGVHGLVTIGFFSRSRKHDPQRQDGAQKKGEKGAFHKARILLLKRVDRL